MTLSQRLFFSNSFLRHAAFNKLLTVLTNNQLITMQVPVIRLLASLAKVASDNVGALISRNVASCFSNLLKHKNPQMLLEVCVALKEFLRAGQKESESLLQQDELITALLQTGEDGQKEVQREVSSCVAQLCLTACPSTLETRLLSRTSLLPLFSSSLRRDNPHPDSLCLVLRALHHLLATCPSLQP